MNILKRMRQVRDPASYAIKQSALGELLGKSETQRNNPRANAKFKKKRVIKN